MSDAPIGAIGDFVIGQSAIGPPSGLTTVGDLITLALQDSGVFGDGQVPSATDSNNALTRLNWLVAQWNRKRWLIYDLTSVGVTSTGAESYSVGPGGDFNTARPDRLEDGNFLRQLNTGNSQQVDYPLELLGSKEDYNRIRLKSMGTWPSAVFYDSNWPLGQVFFWPVPQATTYELFILVKNQISQFDSLTQTINLPPEYEVALSYNLQARLRLAYRMPPDPEINAMAKEALNVIRLANTQVARLRMPSAVVNRQYAYNVYSDEP